MALKFFRFPHFNPLFVLIKYASKKAASFCAQFDYVTSPH